MTGRSFFAAAIWLVCMVKVSAGQQATAAPEHDHEKMMERGQKGMGFSQSATTHHFLLKKDGGVIQVTANDPKDTGTRDEIRMHLQHITQLFSAGDFEIPMFIHDQAPPGAAEMKQLKSEIHYAYAEIPDGAKVVMTSGNAAAVSAIQKFLRFQIEEHQTHDPETVK